VLNSVKGKKERIGRMLEMNANDRTDIDSACAGDIVALVGCKDTTTGETLCDPAHPVILEKMDFPEPVRALAPCPPAVACCREPSPVPAVPACRVPVACCGLARAGADRWRCVPLLPAAWLRTRCARLLPAPCLARAPCLLRPAVLVCARSLSSLSHRRTRARAARARRSLAALSP
jgi:hypothetical protein